MAAQRVMQVFLADGRVVEASREGGNFTAVDIATGAAVERMSHVRRLVLWDPEAGEAPRVAFDTVAEDRLVLVKDHRIALNFGCRCALRGTRDEGAGNRPMDPVVDFEIEIHANRMRVVHLALQPFFPRDPSFRTIVIGDGGAGSRPLRELVEFWNDKEHSVPGLTGCPLEGPLGITFDPDDRVHIHFALSTGSDSQVQTLAFSRRFRAAAGGEAAALLEDLLTGEGRIRQRVHDTWRFQKAPEESAAWVLDAGEFPLGRVLRAWNERVVEPYLHALHTVQSGRPMSLLPRWSHFIVGGNRRPVSSGDPRNGWALLGTVEEPVAPEAAGRPLPAQAEISWRALQPTLKFQAEGDFPGLVTHGGAALAATFAFDLPGDPELSSTDEKPAAERVGPRGPRGRLRMDVVVTPRDEAAVRVGALDLTVAKSAGAAGRMEARFRTGTGGVRAGLPIVDVSLSLPLLRAAPGAQDAVPGEELVAEGASLEPPDDADRLFAREAPLVIPLPGPGAGGEAAARLLLEAREQTADAASQTVVLNLKNQAGGAPGGAPALERALVIDPAPLLVAQVEYPPLTQPDPALGAEVGNWSNGPDAGGWELKAQADGFTLVLPPQGVGEEMERAGNGGVEEKQFHDLEEGKLADYRFSPAARFRLLASYFRQNFAEAPWNLRRILGFPGQRAPGAGVGELTFELLYGLRCHVTAPGLRLAELAALVGQAPGAVEREAEGPELRAARQKGSPLPWVKEWVEGHGAYRLDWAGVFRRHRARLGVLEPWAVYDGPGLVLRDGVEFRLRSAAELRFPADADRIENPELRTHAKDGLAGGVAWPFESTNIYNAVWRTPTAAAAELAEPRFSALGGWGSQKASFDNKRTTIHASVAMGRSFYVATERIGRIGVFWHPAKHVVIYERTVRRAKQFEHQDELRGRPVLRKVREYVEILEKDRRYPEFGAAPVTRGFVEGCSFPPHGRIINVDSRWGRDVGDIGWMLPLWNPEADPEVYPRPEVLLDVAADPDSGAPTQGLRLIEPQKLVFYTDTRADTDSRTDLWPPVWGVDFADVLVPPEPDPLLESDATLAGERPSVPASAPGHERFTYRVAPPARPVNLVLERAGQALGAAISNVTMMRAPALRPLPEKHPQAARMATLVGQASALHALAGEGAGEVLRRLLDDLPAAGKTEEALKKLPGLADQAGEEARRYRAALKELGGFTPDLCGEFRTRAETLFDRASQGAGRLETLRVRLVDVSKRFEAAAGEEWNDTLRGLAKAAVEAFHDVDPEQVPERIEKQLREVLKPLEELINQALALLTKVKSDIEAGTEVEKLRKLARTGLQQLHAVLLAGWARVDEALSRGLGRWAGGRLSAVRVALVQLWTEAQKAITAAEAQIERDFATVDGWRTAVLAEVKKVTDVLEGAKKEAAEGPAAVAAKAHAAFGTWKAAAATLFPVQAAQQLKDLIGAVPPREFAARLRALREPLEEHSVTDTLARWRQGVGTAAATLCGHVVPGQEELKKAVDLLSGMMDPAPVLERLLKTAPPAELTELRRALEAQRAAVDAVLRPAMQGYAEHLRQAVDTARREVQALAANGDSTLRVLRAFGDAPRVPNLEFNRRKVEYWFDEASKQVGMTPVVARVRTALSGAQAELQALGTRIPTRALLDRLLPDALERFSVSKLFPNFAGMDLEGLFPSLRLPANARDNVRITHGVDRQSLQAWLEAVVDVAAAQPATVFAQGPITVRLLRARFQARARVEAAPGRPPATLTTGSISGDWEVAVAGTVLVILRDTSLVYDSTGQLRFNISADRVELQAALRFLSQLMASIGYSESGFSIGMLPLPQVGVRSALDLPLPDLQFGAFGIANLRLLSSFALQMDGGFQVAVALAVGSKTSPFALSVMALTGGGWMEFDARYRPSTGVIQARVTIGIVAGASLRVSLGPIRGGVWVTFGIYAEFRTGAGGGLAIGFVLILAGEVCLAGIVTVSLTLRLEARYGPDGSVTGYGSVSIKIKICWCFTLKIRRDVQYVLVSGSSQQQALAGNEYRDAARDYLNRFE